MAGDLVAAFDFLEDVKEMVDRLRYDPTDPPSPEAMKIGIMTAQICWRSTSPGSETLTRPS